MILYLLDHRHWIDTEYYDTKLIGIFSSQSLVLSLIEQYSQLPGFCDFKSDFYIEPFEILLNKKTYNKQIVYLLTTTQKLDDEEITVSYRLYKNVFIAKLLYLFKYVVLYVKRNKSIYISKHPIDRADWSEGFKNTGDGSMGTQGTVL